MLSKRLACTAALCLLLAAGTTACNDNSDPSAKLDPDRLSAQQISDRAKEAMASASSLKVVLTGGHQSSGEFTLDSKGQCAGHIAAAASSRMDVISDGRTTYVKPVAKAFVADDPAARARFDEALKGRYVTGFENSPFKDLLTLCSRPGIVDEFLGDDAHKRGIEKGSEGAVNGVKTFSLKAISDGGTHSVIHVATEGKPYVVRIEDETNKGVVDFSDYDKPITVTVPPADQTVDFATFTKLLSGSTPTP